MQSGSSRSASAASSEMSVPSHSSSIVLATSLGTTSFARISSERPSGADSVIGTVTETGTFVAGRSVAAALSEGESTVGTHLDVSHLAATPVGMRVRCESELVEVDGRRLVFRLEVFDEAGKVGEGTHERFIIRNERFLAKAEARKTR